MTLDDILNEWKKDSQVNYLDLSKDSSNIPKLHHKYYEIYVKEKLILRKYEYDFKKLNLLKYEFYTMGPHEQTPKEWRLPPQGRILKNEVDTYLEADQDLMDIQLKVNIQKEKTDLLSAIISQINQRNYIIKNIIDNEKFKAGGF